MIESGNMIESGICVITLYAALSYFERVVTALLACRLEIGLVKYCQLFIILSWFSLYEG